jgi:hypothetical protein
MEDEAACDPRDSFRDSGDPATALRGFYMLLRVIICLTAVVGFIRAREEQLKTWLWIYGVLAVLYNPVLPVHLMLRPIWIVANLVTIVLFWAGLLRFRNRLPGSHNNAA